MRRRDFIIGLGGTVGWSPFASSQPGVSDPDVPRLVAGTWIFVASQTIDADGARTDRWGPDVKGILMFDGQDRFAQIIMRPPSLLFGTRAFSAFGTYSIDRKVNAIITSIEGSSNPGAVGLVQHRTIVTLTDRELRYVNSRTASGEMIESAWRRRT